MDAAHRPTARTALLGALGCFVALVALGMAAAWSSALHHIDDNAAQGFIAAKPTALADLTRSIAHLCDVAPYLVLGGGIVAVALLRGRFARAGAVVVLMVATGLTTQTLKSTLGHPRAGDILGLDMGSWPSGHATAAMTLALCGVLVAPRAVRGFVALGGALFALAAGVGVLVMEWHLASDVAGGYLVATMWMLVAVAVLRRVERPAPADAPVAGLRWAWVGAAVLAGIAGARLSATSLADFALDYTWAAFTVTVLCVLAMALAASFAATLRR